jgi:hypothetical protein
MVTDPTGKDFGRDDIRSAMGYVHSWMLPTPMGSSGWRGLIRDESKPLEPITYCREHFLYNIHYIPYHTLEKTPIISEMKRRLLGHHDRQVPGSINKARMLKWKKRKRD